MSLCRLFKTFLFASLSLLVIIPETSAQRFKKKKPETLYARNKKKKVDPVYVGIGTKDPTAQFHTTGAVRFQGLTVNNGLNSIVAVDGNGNLFWRDISNSLANAWFLNGNTVSSSHFFGTNNNEDIRIRTNNNQRAIITRAGLFGIGVAAPTAQLHANGSVRLEGLSNDNALSRLLATDNNGNLYWRDVSSITIGSSAWLMNGNSATAASFLGTTNAEDIRFRVNNIQRAVFTGNGSFGIGVAAPSAQLHTNGTVRMEGVTGNNAVLRLAGLDNSGNLFYRDIASLQTHFWGLNGNAGTNPVNHFIGTTDNNRLVFRTNNTEKMTVLSNGRVGVGTATPLAAFHMTSNAGSLTGHPYEMAVFEKSGDAKISVLSSDNTGAGGAAISLGHSVFNTAGSYAAFELQYGFNVQRYLRFNYVPKDVNGTIQGETANIMIMTDNNRVGINLGPTAGGPTPIFPTANFHTKGTVRLEGLQNGNGNPLVVDANGNVAVGIVSAANVWALTGNTGINPVTNFLGTTDNNKLALRTNNVERLTILADGRVGINNSNPTAQLVINTSNPDNHLRIQGTAPSITFEGSPGANNEGRIGYATQNNNFVNGSLPGDLIVQTLSATNSLIFATTGGGSGNGVERARVTAAGFFGIATPSPTATLHTNGTVRFQNLPTGTGNALVMDANGNVFKSATLTGRPEQEINDLSTRIEVLKREVEDLRAIIHLMKAGTLSVRETGSAPVLYQNNPNPFSHTTLIKYYLPNNTRNAELRLTDMQGNTLDVFALRKGGLQNVSIDGGRFPAGTYFYSLFISGKMVDSKKMVLTK